MNAPDKPKQSKVEQAAEEYSQIVLNQMVVKKWEDVEEQEQAGFLLFPEVIYQRKRDGSWEETPCRLHPLRGHEKRQARKNAREFARSQGVDAEKEPDIFADIDTLCIMQLAIRSTTDPFEPLYATPAELERTHDRDSIAQLFGVLDDYGKVIDPRLEVLSKDQFLTLIAAISEGRSIRPLRAFGGPSQVSSIITMATLLNSLVTGKLLPESFELSTVED